MLSEAKVIIFRQTNYYLFKNLPSQVIWLFTNTFTLFESAYYLVNYCFPRSRRFSHEALISLTILQSNLQGI